MTAINQPSKRISTLSTNISISNIVKEISIIINDIPGELKTIISMITRTCTNQAKLFQYEKNEYKSRHKKREFRIQGIE